MIRTAREMAEECKVDRSTFLKTIKSHGIEGRIMRVRSEVGFQRTRVYDEREQARIRELYSDPISTR